MITETISRELVEVCMGGGWVGKVELPVYAENFFTYGDGNEVGITFVARPKSNRGGFEACFEAKGPNMIEDSMGLGGTGGVCLRFGRRRVEGRMAGVRPSACMKRQSEVLV